MVYFEKIFEHYEFKKEVFIFPLFVKYVLSNRIRFDIVRFAVLSAH